MIIKGGARSSGGFFAVHLMKAEDNERVDVTELRGLLADNVRDALQEMRLVAAGTRAENYFYHASINPREDEHLTPEQWEVAVDRLEHNLGLDGHARFQVEHEKEGRTHRHIVWSRVDLDSMTVTPASGNYHAHDKTRQELEQEFNHEPTPSTPQPSQRKSREFADWENFRAADSGIDPKEVKAEITALWKASDSGLAFESALQDAGYTLCKGDRRDFCIIDSAGDVHSLARRIEGVKTADIRARLTDIDRDSLMTVKDASAWVKAQEATDSGDNAQARIVSQEAGEEPAHFLNPKLRILEQYAHDHPATAPPTDYVVTTSAQDYTDRQEALLHRHQWQLPFLGEQTAPERERHAWNSLQSQTSDVPEKAQDKNTELWQEWTRRVPDRAQEKDEPELER